MLENIFILFLGAALYAAACYCAIKLTVDEMGARSAMFGAGIANMLVGFVMQKLVDILRLIDAARYPYSDTHVLYWILSFGFLILGISGVIMIAVDLLLMIKERYDSSTSGGKSERYEGASPAPAQQDKIPTWKRIQMEEAKTKGRAEEGTERGKNAGQ